MNYYETSDLGLTAALITKGHPVKGLLNKQKKIFFSFEYSKHLIDLVSAYFGSSLEVDSRSYYYNLRDLKKAIYKTYENTK
jgi:hypothetical protein